MEPHPFVQLPILKHCYLFSSRISLSTSSFIPMSILLLLALYVSTDPYPGTLMLVKPYARAECVISSTRRSVCFANSEAVTNMSGLKTMNNIPSEPMTAVLPAFEPTNTPANISIAKPSPYPLCSAIGSRQPLFASFGSVEGIPLLSRTMPSGIRFFSFTANINPPYVLADVEKSTIIGVLLVGMPTDIGFVPKIASFPPHGATAYSEVQKHMPIRLSFANCLV